MTEARGPGDETHIGWTRAAVTTAALLAVVVIALVVVPNEIVTRLTSLERSGRVAVATVWFSLALVGLAVALRRLQARHLI